MRRRVSSMVVMLMALSLGGMVGLGSEGAPLPSPVPWSWTVQNDLLVPSPKVATLGRKLGAELTGIRNTVFNVGEGRTVQINAIVAASEADGDKLFSVLSSQKSEEFLVRRDNVVYELVGPDLVLAELHEAARMLRE